MVHLEVADGADGFDAGRDGVVPVAGGAGVDKESYGHTNKARRARPYGALLPVIRKFRPALLTRSNNPGC
ncbi:hypothetical protein GCM10018780_08220 [Streptomyces lanatus]|nr:hypothetical protein GCM10018780_08220 [Streptomyces lanatus]